MDECLAEAVDLPLDIPARVDETLAGDPEAFAEIVHAYQDDVFNLCFRMLGERAEAEDAAQESFLRAYRNLARYDRQRSFKTWLLSIASNHCIDRLRRRRMTQLSLDDEPTAAYLALASEEPGPEQATITRETSEEIQQLLSILPADYRLVVVLRYWYDHSYSEIAQMSGSSISAVKSKLFRARRRLAEALPGGAESVLSGRRLSAEERLSIPEEGE